MKRNLGFVIAIVIGLFLMVYMPAFAHGTTQVGDYELEIGFHNEPAYQGEPNGLDLFVTNTKTGEKVNGLEDTLQAEIIFGSSKKTLRLEPQEGQDGAYTAYVLPTRTGDYTWHIFGKIGDTPIDVSMTSSPDTFGSVEPKSDYSFPGIEPAASDLNAQIASASRSTQIALIVGVTGAVLGLLGLILGFLGLQATRSRTR